jgi:hypothetical protein
MHVDVVVESAIAKTGRTTQLSAMFDVPLTETSHLEWHADLPVEEKPWNVGLIVGPSGSGKTLTSRQLFGKERPLKWSKGTVVDDFAEGLTMEEISAVCSAVGFNTIPAWMRPYSVLSNGEQFRVRVARSLLESDPAKPIVMDEFTSVVDRQVAKIGSHAVQKWIRKKDRQFVAVSCHYDIEDWLQPDWTFEPATGIFTWRSVQPRPQVEVEIQRVDHSAWQLFAPYHYLTAHLHKGAQCFVLFANGEPAVFVGVLHRPHPKVKDIIGISRVVTLPDWQGMGLAFVMMDNLGAIYSAIGKRLRNYPAHPALIHAHDHSPLWALKQRPGYMNASSTSRSAGNRGGPQETAALALAAAGANRTGDVHERKPRGVGSAGNTKTGPNAKIGGQGGEWAHGSRPCGVFEYAGPKWPDVDQARAIIQGQ